MIKLLAVGAIIVSSSALGMTLSSKLSKRAKQLAVLKKFAEEVKENIRYSSLRTDKLIESVISKSEYDFLNDRDLFVNDEDKKIYLEFLSGLGKTDTKGQMTYCDLWSVNFKNAAEKAQLEYSQKGKLYNILGVCAGLAVSLIIV